MNNHEAWESLDLKFTSGNKWPVERAMILKSEYEAIKAERDEMIESLLEIIKFDGEILKEDFQLKIINLIESATGKSIEEVIQ